MMKSCGLIGMVKTGKLKGYKELVIDKDLMSFGLLDAYYPGIAIFGLKKLKRTLSGAGNGCP